MPFELGIAYALCADRMSFVVFEREAYRIQTTLSDLNGIDPVLYDGTPKGMIDGILEVFVETKNLPDAANVLAVFELTMAAIKSELDLSAFSRRAFKLLLAVIAEASTSVAQPPSS